MKRLTAITDILLLTVCGLLAPVYQSVAELSLVTKRDAINTSDVVDWGSLSPPFTKLYDPTQVTSLSGLVQATVNNPTGDLMRFDQGNGWWGNFAYGARLLTTDYTTGPIIIEFTNPVAATGAQIQRNQFGVFRAKLEAFDAAGLLLGSFTTAGYSTAYQDDAALFLGVFNNRATIKRIVYSTDDNTSGFAVNQLSVLNSLPSPVPALSAGGMITGAALMIGAALCRRRHKRSPQ